MSLLSAAHSQVLLVDVQEKLLPTIADGEAIARRCAFVLTCAGRLAIPVTVSEQYPKGLGPTLPFLIDGAPAAPRFAKTIFSALGDAAIADCVGALRGQGRGQLVLIGIEAHVCVLQTALHARRAGYEVFVVADAVGSRSTRDREAGLARMEREGVAIITAEMAMFEWLERSGTDDFKALSALIRG
ncbi:MAG: hydrolase [Labrys sp. (in: a-proteobacteria)]|jgi:nicotinamidase-related amidase